MGRWSDLLTLHRIPPLNLSSMIKMARVIVSLPLRLSLFPFPLYSAPARASTVSGSDLPSLYCPDRHSSHLDQGSLRVDILDGKDIPAVDRAGECSHFTSLWRLLNRAFSIGTSDPYVLVILNGERVYKTEVKKKSLTPVWNETFTAMLNSRVGADFTIEVVNRRPWYSGKRSSRFLIV